MNWIYGYGLAGAATQPVGNYVSMFRVTVIGDSLTADREVTWKAIANIRGVWVSAWPTITVLYETAPFIAAAT